MQKMYPAVVNSPKTELVAAITETDAEIEVADISVLLQSEGLVVIGNGEGAETVKYTSVEGNVLKGCIRGFQGVAKPWAVGTRLARNFTAYDHDAFKWNIEAHDSVITVLKNRLDTSDTDPVTLQPGLQVVKAAKDARFKLGEIKGKTEINGQGRIGIIGVENPYVIGTSKNLLPPFYEWGHVGPGARTVVNPYYLQGNSNGTGEAQNDSPDIPVTAGKYSLSVDELGAGGYLQVIQNGVVEFLNSTKLSATFTLAAGTVKLRFAYTTASTVYIKNPMLTLGTVPKPFQPQRKSMLAFQTELHANPTDGSDPDVLFQRDGQYFKLAKWKKVVLDGALNWLGASPFSGFKVVVIDMLGGMVGSQAVTKYNGTVLAKKTGSFSGPDMAALESDNKLRLTVSNEDSGWGDNYNPTPDEIKAYFMGWKMYDINGSANDPYNRTDGTAKGWVYRLVDVPWGPAVTTVPTTQAPINTRWQPYQLLYRLVKDTVEPVVSEGSLTLTEGDNMVEVGTGIVLREHAPVLEVPGSGAAMGDVSAPTKFKIERFLTAYKNNRPDYKWYHVAGNAYGLDKARILWEDYDKNAAYTLTYLKLDKSPIQPITGTLAANEKAQISDLTAGVAEALQRVSVVEQKKADEDAPGWITPTLINGASQFSDTYYGEVGYRLTSDGLLQFRGLLRTENAATAFRLADGYKPAWGTILSIPGAGAWVEMRIHADGRVDVHGAYDWISLGAIPPIPVKGR